jgi:hypothetical protein
MGLRMCQLLATICVTSSLALVTLDGSDLTRESRLQTLSFGKPLSNRGPIWDMTSVSHAVIAGVMCE